MSQEKVLKTLESMGLEKLDAQVYIFLGKKGPQKGKDIAKALKIPKQRLYIVLKSLQNKGIVNSTLERPARFSVLPFDKTLDLFVKAKIEEAQRIEGGKDEILSDWQSISITEAADQSPKFTVIEGRNSIYPRLKQMIEDTKNQLSIIFTDKGLMRADQFGLLDAAFSHSSEKDMKFRFLTEISKENLKTTKLLLTRTLKTGARFEGRTPELGLKLTLRMLIRDDAEAAFFVSQEACKEASEIDDVCVWTNSSSIVNSFKAVFEDFWRNSIDLEKKILEIETGKTHSQTFVICNEESAKKEYIEKVLSAKKELLIMTSSQGLLNLETRILQLKELHQRNVAIKVIAPLTSENLKAAQQIFRYCKIRHAAINYTTTTIIDGEHLFQFKTPQNQRQPESSDQFESTIYTNDSEYVGKTRLMFSEIWNNAQTPFLAQSAPQIVSSESAMHSPPDENRVKAYRRVDSYVEDPVFLGVDAQKDILKRILSAKRVKIKDPLKEPVIHYGSIAQAFVYPPESANLPNMLIRVFHSNAQSSFGAENWLFVRVLRQTSEGYTYVPTVYVGTSPKAVAFWKNNSPGLWTEKNCLLFKKDQLEVRSQGNTLFAGWTKPISLSPFLFTLPPACMFFEGYGDLRTSISKITGPLGRLIIHEINAFEAFATFYNPSWKYSAPGTEGLFMRDSVFTLNPISKN
jgi:HTH-type transcriptional regulator, sugar sensing transcriptional regulator